MLTETTKIRQNHSLIDAVKTNPPFNNSISSCQQASFPLIWYQLAFKQDNNLTDSREDPTDIPSCQSNDGDTFSTDNPFLDRLSQLEQNRKNSSYS